MITWSPGGNLTPMLAVASLLHRRGHEVTVLASGETRGAADRLGLEVSGYRRSPDPDVRVAFEAQAELMMATMAGADLALDVRDVLNELHPEVAVADCMLPAALAAARATGTPAVSLVHFLYGLARTQMLHAGGAGRPTSATWPRRIGCLGLLSLAMASARGRRPSWCW